VPEVRQPFLLDDLSVQSDEALRARRKMTPGGRLAVLSLKHGRDPIRIEALSPDGRKRAARGVLVSILRYIFETSRTEPDKLRGLLARQLGRKQAEAIMTTAEMLRREGRKEGEARGELSGKRELLLRLLRQRFGRLPATTTARIDKAAAADLTRWADRMLTAASLDEVLGTKTRRRA
jgi:hypothetical protein